MAGLTTHVLDVTCGGPAAGVRVELYEFAADGGRRLVATTTTNADGRTDAPLIAAGEARVATFELVFHAGDYFRAQGARLADPPFLDLVPIRFAVADPSRALPRPLASSRLGATRPIGELRLVTRRGQHAPGRHARAPS